MNYAMCKQWGLYIALFTHIIRYKKFSRPTFKSLIKAQNITIMPAGRMELVFWSQV